MPFIPPITPSSKPVGSSTRRCSVRQGAPPAARRALHGPDCHLRYGKSPIRRNISAPLFSEDPTEVFSVQIHSGFVKEPHSFH